MAEKLGLSGSSPRGQGKPNLFCDRVECCRLIPARAGKTHACLSGPRYIGAHPRAGGENQTPVVCLLQDIGSSPRGRGKLEPRAGATPSAGLIPARAGKTLPVVKWSFSTWAHPRAGGENSRINRPASAARGSSPRGRGKLREARVPLGGRGLIPARAGKTGRFRREGGHTRAHPRAGGENARGRE